MQNFQYHHRTLEKYILKISKQFPVILLTGARQVGKTTLFRKINNGKKYITLDDPIIRTLAKKDPALFFKKFKPPVVIDEIQYAPELLPYIKIIADEYNKSDLIWLTGSQHFHLMKNVSESLAGRVAIINLSGFSMMEIYNKGLKQSPFIPKNKEIPSKPDLYEIYKKIWRGFFPKIAINPDIEWEIFYSSYTQTYLQRDIRELSNIQDELRFINFLKILASRTGQLLNYSDISKEVGISVNTVKKWISILKTSNIIFLLNPFHSNISKRLIKSPKLYFLDTGLCSYLTEWTTYKTLEAGAFSGNIFETFVVGEIIKSYLHNGKQPPIYYYRDKDKNEIDLIIFKNGKVYPLEIKKYATPDKKDIKKFDLLEKLGLNIGIGGIICFTDEIIPLSEKYYAFPVNILWS